MASYDRRILIPYLQDVCAVEMLCRKLEQEVKQAKSEADHYYWKSKESYKDPKEPKEPNWDDYKVECNYREAILSSLAWSSALGVMGLFFMFFRKARLVGVFFIVVWLLLAWLNYFPQKKDIEEKQEKARKKYDEAVMKYNQALKEYRKNAPIWRKSGKSFLLCGRRPCSGKTDVIFWKES